jgi:hypothetical protein
MGTQGVVSVLKGGKVVAKITVGCNGQKAGSVGKEIIAQLRDIDVTRLEIICDYHGFGDSNCRVIAVRPKAGELGLLISYSIWPGIKATADDRTFGRMVKHFDDPTFNSRWEHGTADRCVIVDLDKGKMRYARHGKPVSKGRGE